MPRDSKTRHRVRRKLEQAANLVNNANQHIAEAAQPFKDTRGEYYELFLSVGAFTEQCRFMIRRLRDKI